VAALDGVAVARSQLATAGLGLPNVVAAAHAETARSLACMETIVQALHEAQVARQSANDAGTVATLGQRIANVGAVANEVKVLMAAYGDGLERLLGAVSPGVRYQTVAAIAQSHQGIPAPSFSALLTRLNLTRAAEADAGVRQAITEQIKTLRRTLPPTPRSRPGPQ